MQTFQELAKAKLMQKRKQIDYQIKEQSIFNLEKVAMQAKKLNEESKEKSKKKKLNSQEDVNTAKLASLFYSKLESQAQQNIYSVDSLKTKLNQVLAKESMLTHNIFNSQVGETASNLMNYSFLYEAKSMIKAIDLTTFNPVGIFTIPLSKLSCDISVAALYIDNIQKASLSHPIIKVVKHFIENGNIYVIITWPSGKLIEEHKSKHIVDYIHKHVEVMQSEGYGILIAKDVYISYKEGDITIMCDFLRALMGAPLKLEDVLKKNAEVLSLITI